MSQAVEAMPLLLHVAVFLFFVGPINFLFPVETHCVSAFVPSLNNPYSTPPFGFTWNMLQIATLNHLPRLHLRAIIYQVEGLIQEYPFVALESASSPCDSGP
ncbi:hypothetical protein BJY52DRAFT_1238180 [Lactarius psammicola]|nr:hypothetical protein BJY52DRAFT_1238180 [Lactarius psammicola]